MDYYNKKEICNKIKELGKLWRNSPDNISNFADKNVLNEWEQLIIDWKDNLHLPLIIRKSTQPRGSEIEHITGRKIIISDNSFPQWVYYNVLLKRCFTCEQIKNLLEKDEIPFSFALKNKEKTFIKYKKTLGKYSINEKWNSKLCHIEPVGVNSKLEIQNIPIDILENHFLKLGNPKNMFLIDLEIGALGELQDFIDQQRYN